MLHFKFGWIWLVHIPIQTMPLWDFISCSFCYTNAYCRSSTDVEQGARHFDFVDHITYVQRMRSSQKWLSLTICRQKCGSNWFCNKLCFFSSVLIENTVVSNIILWHGTIFGKVPFIDMVSISSFGAQGIFNKSSSCVWWYGGDDFSVLGNATLTIAAHTASVCNTASAEHPCPIFVNITLNPVLRCRIHGAAKRG